MATSTSDSFPLATDEPYNAGGDSGPGSISSDGSIDDSAGASGSSPGVVQISHGAIVAIIVVVAVVCVLGSKSLDPMLFIELRHTNTTKSLLRYSSTWRRRGNGRLERLSGVRQGRWSLLSHLAGPSSRDQSRNHLATHPGAVFA